METNASTSDSNPCIEQVMIALLGVQLGTLRSIKDMELAWLERYSVLILPAIGFLVVRDPKEALPAGLLVGITLGYLLLTIWMQDLLRKERRSYYRVLRSVIRAENFLGLYKIAFFADVQADAAFPKGLGPNLARDGTQPYSSFLNRQIYTLIAYSAVVASAIYQASVTYQNAAFLAVFAFVDLAWLFWVFWKDRIDLYQETLAEKGLAGAEPSWYPQATTSADVNNPTAPNNSLKPTA